MTDIRATGAGSDFELEDWRATEAQTGSARPYDEAVDAEGRLRPAYAAMRRRTRSDPLRPPRAVDACLRDRPLGDRASILPVPLLLVDDEYRSVIQAGAAQRVRALQMFFRDAVLGRRRFVGGESGLSADRFDELLASEGTSLGRLRRQWASRSDEEIRFVYGPDLVRDENGHWVVLEDNVGCVGGSADSFYVAERYLQATGVSADPCCPLHPDLCIAVERWLRRLELFPADNRVMALLGCEPADDALGSPDLAENARRAQLMARLGIPAVGTAECARLWRSCDRPQAVVNFDFDSQLESDVLVPSLRVPLLNSPGTGVLGNKALLPYVSDMVRFFSGEEPILRTPTTYAIRDGELPERPSDWVVKTTTGAGGTGVFMLGTQTADELEAVQAFVRASGPSSVVAQRYVQPSTLPATGQAAGDPYRVELRPVTYVIGWQEAVVAEQPVGKAVSSSDRRRLGNVSRGAAYVAVLREAAALHDERAPDRKGG